MSQVGTAEFEILKAAHKFLREGEDEANDSWNDKLAAKYYSSLFREFAVCDLKHYKSGQFALRWRSESEVISERGETTCGNTRCQHHSAPADTIPLSTLELPFGYVENDVQKSALVKVVLCGRCVDKLMWKRRKEKERELEEEQPVLEAGTSAANPVKLEEIETGVCDVDNESKPEGGRSDSREHTRRRRRTRSRSPRSRPSHSRHHRRRPS